MAKRTRKSPIGSEQAQDWLQRFESGESPPKIADRDGFDVRTVRKHIEAARQEREVKEARFMVLRNALQDHYGDLCGYAERLSLRIAGSAFTVTPEDDYLDSALRQHLPHSPMWRYLNKWDSLRQDVDQLKQKAAQKIERRVRLEKQLKPIISAGEDGVIAGIIDALKFQFEEWARGYNGLKLAEDLILEPAEEGFANLRYGFAQMGKVRQEHIAIIRKVLNNCESRIKHWDDYRNLERNFAEQKQVSRKLRDELAVIKLKRIVPGRCRYCPF